MGVEWPRPPVPTVVEVDEDGNPQPSEQESGDVAPPYAKWGCHLFADAVATAWETPSAEASIPGAQV